MNGRVEWSDLGAEAPASTQSIRDDDAAAAASGCSDLLWPNVRQRTDPFAQGD